MTDEQLLAERPSCEDPYPEGVTPPPFRAITGDEWGVMEASPKPPGYRAALALSRITEKLMLSIVGKSYSGESDPRYDTMDQVAKIRRCCDIIEEAVKVAAE